MRYVCLSCRRLGLSTDVREERGEAGRLTYCKTHPTELMIPESYALSMEKREREERNDA